MGQVPIGRLLIHVNLDNSGQQAYMQQQTEESAEVLGNDNEGWFGEHATQDVMEVANKPLQTNHKFEDMFKCDPKAKYYGYKSWDRK